jgi:hypothetical protein
MTNVKWPRGSIVDDFEVCDWLEALVNLFPESFTFDFDGQEIISFVREDDAIAFRLKFGL